MSCTDYLVFQTQEPADMKCGKAQALKHSLYRHSLLRHTLQKLSFHFQLASVTSFDAS